MDLIEMYPAAVNSKVTVTLGVLNADSTIIEVLDGSVLPDAPNLLVLGSDQTAETVKLTAKEGNTLTVERGIQGNAIAWPAGTQIARNFTAKDWDDLIANVATIVAKILGLTAADVHARPDTWMPSASDVGAVSVNDSSKAISLETLNTSTEDLQGYIDGTVATAIGLDDIFYSVFSHYNGGNRTQIFIPISDALNVKLRIMHADSVRYVGDFAIGHLPLDGSVPMSGAFKVKDYGLVDSSAVYTSLWAIKDANNRRYFRIFNPLYEVVNVPLAIQWANIVDGTEKVYNIFSEHNKPSGSYTGNGSATGRDIVTGGIGALALVWSSNGAVLITPMGALKLSSSHSFIGAGQASINSDNAKIWLATTDVMLNENGVLYQYRIL